MLKRVGYSGNVVGGMVGGIIGRLRCGGMTRGVLTGMTGGLTCSGGVTCGGMTCGDMRVRMDAMIGNMTCGRITDRLKLRPPWTTSHVPLAFWNIVKRR